MWTTNPLTDLENKSNLDKRVKMDSKADFPFKASLPVSSALRSASVTQCSVVVTGIFQSVGVVRLAPCAGFTLGPVPLFTVSVPLTPVSETNAPDFL